MLEERTPTSVFLESDPAFDPLRGEPRFKAMITQLRG
jgi:hypothetical protein